MRGAIGYRLEGQSVMLSVRGSNWKRCEGNRKRDKSGFPRWRQHLESDVLFAESSEQADKMANLAKLAREIDRVLPAGYLPSLKVSRSMLQNSIHNFSTGEIGMQSLTLCLSNTG